MLKCDRVMCPSSTPLLDTLDLVSRSNTLALRWHSHDRGGVTASTYDLNHLNTNFIWDDLRCGFRFWRFRCGDNSFAPHACEMEQSFAELLFARIDRWEFDTLRVFFPFLTVAHSPQLFVGEVLLALVLSHNIFECSSLGVSRQKVGFSMGINCAPAWANVILCAYEESSMQTMPELDKQQRGFLWVFGATLMMAFSCILLTKMALVYCQVFIVHI